jgi:hypothetical protein
VSPPHGFEGLGKALSLSPRERNLPGIGKSRGFYTRVLKMMMFQLQTKNGTENYVEDY